MTRKIRYYTQDEYDAELEHRRINMKMNWLDKFSGKVAIGFFVWGVIYLAMWVGAFVYFFG